MKIRKLEGQHDVFICPKCGLWYFKYQDICQKCGFEHAPEIENLNKSINNALNDEVPD